MEKKSSWTHCNTVCSCRREPNEKYFKYFKPKRFLDLIWLFWSGWQRELLSTHCIKNLVFLFIKSLYFVSPLCPLYQINYCRKTDLAPYFCCRVFFIAIAPPPPSLLAQSSSDHASDWLSSPPPRWRSVHWTTISLAEFREVKHAPKTSKKIFFIHHGFQI